MSATPPAESASRPPAHATPWAALIAAQASDGEQGLEEAEVLLRQQRWGPNSLAEQKQKPAWQRFLGQFHDPLLYTLLAVGAVKLLLGQPGEAIVIWSVTVINAVIGYVQESRAETAIAALARSVRTDVEVVRDGVRRRLDSEQLVPGDLVVLEAGDKVPADLRLLHCRNLQIDESALTGESLPVTKGTTAVEVAAPLAERIGMAYAGSLVTAGQGRALVVATGSDTEVGRISGSLAQQVNLSTPLTHKFRGCWRGSPSWWAWPGAARPARCSTAPWPWPWGRSPRNCRRSSPSPWPSA